MTHTTHLLGIDVSTTGSKALLIDSQGGVVASATNEYPVQTPRPNWSEQDPADWWRATARSVRQVLERAEIPGQQVAAVGLAGQMHGAVLLDQAGEVIRPAILWNDQRTAKQCEEITERVGTRRIVELTGNPVLTGFTAPKLLWVQQHEREAFDRIDTVLLPKDYVRYRLTGQRFSDVSDASGTSLFDVARRQWSDEMLDAVGVNRSWLAEVTESPEVSARVNGEAAAETGLTEGTPVVGGAGDQAAQAVGSGVIAEGLVSATIGTSGVVFAASKTYRADPEGKLHAFCHAVPGMWHLMGVMLSAGGSLRWYRDTLCEAQCAQAKQEGRDPYDLLCEAAADVPAGSEGLLFLPYLTGERTPHADPHARGVFFGLSPRHTKAHLTRAVLEGVAFGLLDSMRLMEELGLSIEQVRVSGGGARSGLWRRILADVFDRPVCTVNTTEGAAYGAALLAAVGAGIFPSVEEASRATVQVGPLEQPGWAVGTYQKTAERYRALYAALESEFPACSESDSA